MRKPSSTRQRILQEGLAVASLAGFEGLTFGTLAERAHLSKSGLFAHFQSRDDLQKQILEEAQALFRHSVIEPAQQAPQGLPRLRALWSLWVGWAPRSGLPGGCPFVAAAVEVDDSEGPLREHVEQSQLNWSTLFQSVVEQAIACDHLSQQVDPQQFTWEAFGIYLVYHFSSRLLRDLQAEERAHQAFERLVQSPPLLKEELS
ncbi:MAG TPA: TetR/AcrR family transcriptional regulator [Ktedonosporobacter sp.]|nr:TetR/AcrR family transcriptional regulator [Ktedonosporobacter sp.]